MPKPVLIPEPLGDQITTTLFNYFQIGRKLPIKPVDFEKPWPRILLLRKYRYGLALVSQIIQSAYENLMPIFLTSGFIEQRLDWVVLAIGGYALLELLNRVVFVNFLIAQNTVGVSYFTAAYGFFLTTYPINHSTKFSGKIFEN